MNKEKLSTVLFMLSSVLILVPLIFKNKASTIILVISWALLSISRSLLTFRGLHKEKGKVKLLRDITDE